MISRIVTLLIISAIYVLFELYTLHGVGTAFKGTGGHKAALTVHVASIAITILAFITIFTVFRRGFIESSLIPNLLLGLAFTFFITKLVFAVFLLSEDVYRILKYGYDQIAVLFTSPGSTVDFESRRKFISQLGLVVAALPFSSFLYGVVKGKYDFRVKNITLTYPDLPQAFDGFRIVQISDIHSGSFDSFSSVKKGVEMVQQQNPDLILFTGDLVNNMAMEIEPYMDLFGSLSARFGKYSVLGNHDYGDYMSWPSQEAKKMNLDKLKEYQQIMGYKLLNNTSVRVEKGQDSILLAGVENWGIRPFRQTGDLEQAYRDSQDDEFTILMSHDPSHWDEQVLDFKKHVHLTLSGHTHGMQMGIEIPGIKWSPVKYKYPRWAGLYEDKGQYLYVNRGFGFIGFPGRVGIWPEITTIELKRAQV